MKTGLLIKELRIKKGLTQEQLAAKTELSTRTIQRIENGEVDPRSYSLQMIANALEVDFNIFTEHETEESHEMKTVNNNTAMSFLHLSGVLPLIFPLFILWHQMKDKTELMALHFKAALILQFVILGISLGSLFVYFKTGILTPFYGSLLVGALMAIMNAIRAMDGKSFINPFFKLKNKKTPY